jgi:hypothetical protein
MGACAIKLFSNQYYNRCSGKLVCICHRKKLYFYQALCYKTI